MWRGIKPLPDPVLRDFETAFHFNLNSVFREYLLEHNAGLATPGTFPTKAKERKLERLLDFADLHSPNEAWATNKRLRAHIGPKRVVIGVDTLGNFICLQRHERQQTIVLWNHLSGEFEECLLDIPAFLRAIG